MPNVSYRQLDAWQLSMALAEMVYELTRLFPADERFGLTAQLRRSAVGIPSHVGGGHHQGRRAYRRYVVAALGALADCDTQLELAERLRLAPPAQIAPVRELASRVGQALHGLRRSLSDARAPVDPSAR